MYLVGLTGGIGSGKSTVAERLRELGCDVIDADQVAREIVEPGEPALVELVERFGPAILADDGRLDRAALAGIVFVDDDARADLERITHPRIQRRIQERILGSAAGATSRLTVVDHPLLIESGQTDRFDALVVVVADEAVRLRRLVEHRGLASSDARARMHAQTDDGVRRAVATHVIENSGSLEQLHAQVDAVHAELVSRTVPPRGGTSRAARER